jgi:hypothetical protein
MSGKARLGSAAVLSALTLLAFALLPPAAAFDPAVLSLSQGYPEANVSAASAFRIALEENLTACAWPGCSGLERSDDVHVAVEGPDRIGGATVASYNISVSGVPGFSQNYTTIAVVLNASSPNVIMSADETAEVATNVAYTKLLNGSTTMKVNVIGPNASGNLSLYVFGYVGDGNRTTHEQHHVYNLEVKRVETRATRTVPLNVTVSNRQNVTATGVPVSFYVKGPGEDAYAHVGNTTVATIVANGEATAVVNWDATWANDTVYTVKAVIDPEHRFPETNEENNVRFFQVNLGPEAAGGGEGPAPLIGYGVVVTFFIIVLGIFWYNRRYE